MRRYEPGPHPAADAMPSRMGLIGFGYAAITAIDDHETPIDGDTARNVYGHGPCAVGGIDGIGTSPWSRRQDLTAKIRLR